MTGIKILKKNQFAYVAMATFRTAKKYHLTTLDKAFSLCYTSFERLGIQDPKRLKSPAPTWKGRVDRLK